MKKRKILILAALFGVSITVFLACTTKPQEIVVQKNVGVACYNKSDAFLSELLSCLKEDCEERDMTVTIRDAVGSQRTQNDQVQELLDEGCDVLCVNLVDRTDPSAIIDMAREKDVQIIFFNREPVAEDLKQWTGLYYIGADAEQSGVMQGELAAQMIENNAAVDRNGDGKIQYAILEGEPNHQDAIIRTESVVNTLKNSGIELERLSYQIANWNRAQAQNRMNQIIGQYPTEIEVVLANNDAMALGAIDAYKELGYEKSQMPLFFGIDGTDEGLNAVKEGELAATVYNDKESQAELMADLVYAIVKGDSVEEFTFEKKQYIYLPYQKVTPENVNDFFLRKIRTEKIYQFGHIQSTKNLLILNCRQNNTMIGINNTWHIKR